MAWLTYLLYRTHVAPSLRRRRLLASSPLRLFDRVALTDAAFLAVAGFSSSAPCSTPGTWPGRCPSSASAPGPAWLLFTGTVFVFYAHGFAPPHVEFWWVKLLEYAPPLLARPNAVEKEAGC